ncbi:MAG: hypothetical protein U0835_01750 [Isosphaeraceae bacterium]
MTTEPHFPDLAGAEPAGRPPADLGPAQPPRLRRPDREQMLMRPCSVDELIGDDHDARLVWRLVETWDLTAFLVTIRARGETPGRSATDPRLLVALWLYAATQGVAGGGNWHASASRAPPTAGSAARCRSTTTCSTTSGSATRRRSPAS